MAYDFSKVAQEAAKSAAQSGEQKEFKYKLVYPGEGKIKFRLLYNPKSGLLGRLITRHNIEGKKVLCASTYSHKSDCPICKVLEDISNMGLTFPREYNPKTRAIYLAQFVSADYEVASGNLKKGDVFILMVPYTVYKAINKWVADFSSDSSIMAKVFSSHEYSVQVIEKGKEATDWTFRPDPNITIESAKTDDEFCQMLEGLDSLYDLCGFHEKITPEEVALMHTTADGLRDSFISGSSMQKGYVPPVAPVEDRTPVQPTPVSQVAYQQPTAQPVNYQQPATAQVAYQQPVAQPQAAPQAPTQPAGAPNRPETAPSCWGGYVGPENTDPARKANQTRCKYCPVSTMCKDASIPF